MERRPVQVERSLVILTSANFTDRPITQEEFELALRTLITADFEMGFRVYQSSAEWPYELAAQYLSARNDTASAYVIALVAVFAGFVHNTEDKPILDARVDCMFLGATNLPQFAGGDTDEQGHFSFELPAIVPSLLHCGVTAPNGVIAAFDSPPTTSADFKLASETARLLIPDWGKKLQRHVYWLVTDDGRMFSLSWAAGKLERLWTPLSIAGVPAGSWKIVRADTLERWTRLATVGGNALSSLADFSLRQGGSQTVRLYASADH
jgi:hypothetical protein